MPTKDQLALLRVAKARLGLNEETYRGILRNHGGVASAKDLRPADFDAVMARFRDLGFTSDARKGWYGDRRGMASAAQVALIRKLFATVAEEPSEASLNAWLEKYQHVSSLRFLTDAGAQGAITALKAWGLRTAASDGRRGPTNRNGGEAPLSGS